MKLLGWAVWTPARRWTLRSGRRLASVVKEMRRVSRMRGWVTILDDEVD